MIFEGITLVSTIPHTGTTSLIKQFEKGTTHLTHCGDLEFDQIHKWDSIVTTYRDPYRTLASWGNRGMFEEPLKGGYHPPRWIRAWDNWGKLVAYAKVYPIESLPCKENTYKDKLGLHKALDENDMETFFKHVSKELLDHALGVVHKIGFKDVG